MASMKCPECGHAIMDQTRFCPGCGRPVIMITCCPKCGSHHVTTLHGVRKAISKIMYKLFPEDTKKCAYQCDVCKYKF